MNETITIIGMHGFFTAYKITLNTLSQIPIVFKVLSTKYQWFFFDI